MNESIKDIGAYLQIYRQNGKPDFTLSHFRRHYPNSKIYLLSDNGDDFSSLAKEHGCKYVFSPINTNPPAGFSKFQMIEWIGRLKKCCDYCNSEFILYLEDDVFIRNKIKVDTNYAISGVYENDIPQSVIEYVKKEYPTANFNSRRYGACGGTVYNREVFINNFEKMEIFINKHFDHINNNISFKISFCDCIMCVMYMAFGYEYGLNKEMIEPFRVAKWMDLPNSIVHIGVDSIQEEIMKKFK